MPNKDLLPVKTTQMLVSNDPQEVQAYKIQAERTQNKRKTPGREATAPETTLRQRILSLSLFPNPYNRGMMLKYGVD